MSDSLKLSKTTFQDDIEFRFDLLGGELLARVVREVRKFLPGITQDDKSKAWIWKGLGVEEDPWYWVKISATDIVSFSGYFTGDENWQRFRADIRKALVHGLGEIEIAFVSNMTSMYGWVVPPEAVEQKLPDLMKFSRLFAPENAREIERFSTLVFDPESQNRIFLEGTRSEEGFRLSLNVQSNRFDKSSFGEALEDHFTFTDAAYKKANSQIEKLFT